MIPEEYKKFTNFDCESTVEGKLLMAALSVLTSIDKKEIRKGQYGGMNHPDTVMENLWDLANYIFHQKEHEEWKLVENRDKKIDILIH
jgi:hypothetical protein